MGQLKESILAFLDSKNTYARENSRRRGSIERYMSSAATSLYSVDRAPSFVSSSARASAGSSIRTESMIFLEPAGTSTLAPAQSSCCDDETPCPSENQEAQYSPGSSSSTVFPLPQVKLEYIHIPPSLLGPDTVDAEHFWSELAPQLKLDSPAPYRTFQELYLSIYPFLWLHGRIWHGDRATHGTLLVTRYSPQSGKIECSNLLAVESNDDPLRKRVPRFELESAIVSLRHEHFSGKLDDRENSSQYSLHRVSPIPAGDIPSFSERSLWPPVVFPAEERTSRALSRPRAPPGVHRIYSLNLIEMRKTTNRALDILSGSQLELFAALDPGLYTPNDELPYKGIWCRESNHGYEFTLFHQTSRIKVEGLKLTGNSIIPRGARYFIFEDIQAETSRGTIGLGLRRLYSKSPAGKLSFQVGMVCLSAPNLADWYL